MNRETSGWVLLMPSVSYHRTRCAICSSHTSLLATGAECCFSFLGLCLVRLVSVPRLSVDLVAFSVARQLRGVYVGCVGFKNVCSSSKFLVHFRARSPFGENSVPLTFAPFYQWNIYKQVYFVHIYILFIIGLVIFSYNLEAFMKLMSTYKFRL